MTDQTPTDDSTALSPEQAAADAAPQRFDTLPLDAKLLRAVADSGYTAMTPIQAKAIPLVLAGRDVMGAAQTGTGKTAAFSIPLLQKMMKHETASMSPARHPVRALVLTPTRELAEWQQGPLQLPANLAVRPQQNNVHGWRKAAHSKELGHCAAPCPRTAHARKTRRRG